MASTFQLDTHVLDALIANLEPQAEAVLDRTAEAIKADIGREMRRPKSGIIYARGRMTKRTTWRAALRRAHQASAPGEAPAIDTGALVNSVDIERGRLWRTVHDGVEYGIYLELLLNRPFMVPAFERQRKPWAAAFAALFRPK
jgi:hypothetical protein